MVGYINLTRGEVATVDDDDYEELSKVKWYAAKQPNTFYACRDIRVDGKRKTLWMHRVINKTPAKMVTDHIDGNGLDNRKLNLRSVTHQENMINSGRWSKNKRKYRGVSWHKNNKFWIAQITVDKKNIYLGSFSSELDAKKAYDEAFNKYRKEYITRRKKYD